MQIRPLPIVLAASAVLFAGSTTLAQTYSIALQEGDAVPGVGNVALISGVRTNNLGQLLIATDTDNPDTDTDFVVLLDGTIIARQGDPIAPAGASINLIDEFDLNNLGNYAFNTTLSGTTAATDEAIYYNGNLLLQQGATLTGAPFPAGTTLIDTDGIRLNDAGSVLVRGDTSNGEVLFTIGTGGEMSLIAMEGQTLPGLTDAVQTIDLAPEGYSINNSSGQVLFVGDTSGLSPLDNFIYLSGSGPVAVEGAASPVGGLNWGSLTSADVSLNDNGQYAHTGRVASGSTADDSVLMVNDTLIAREGGAVPQIDGAVFSDLISAKFALDEAGNLLWAAGFDLGGSNDRALFYNDTLLLQEGVSTVEGLVVEGFPLSSETLSFSDDGRFALVEVTLEGGLETAVFIAIPEPASAGLLAAVAPFLLMRRRRA